MRRTFGKRQIVVRYIDDHRQLCTTQIVKRHSQMSIDLQLNSLSDMVGHILL